MIGEEIAGLTIRCRPRPFRQHAIVPGFPVALEPIENILVSVPEIGPLARVLDDIEQELVAGDLQILPIAVAHGALFASLEAPEQLARMGRRAPSEDWQEIVARPADRRGQAESRWPPAAWASSPSRS